MLILLLDRIFLLVSNTMLQKKLALNQILQKRPLFDVNTTHLDVLCYQIDHFMKLILIKKLHLHSRKLKR